MRDCFLVATSSRHHGSANALAAGASLLEIKCNACRMVRRINLQDLVWPRKNQVHSLRPKLFCEPCKIATGRKVRPLLIGLFDPNPQPEPPARAAGRV